MGNDGGSIPTRRELVKSANRAPTLTDLKEKQKEHLAHRWSQCPISHKALRKPIVSDSAGNLYNKDAIIEFLLPAEAGGDLDRNEAETFIQGRIRGLKDVVEVLFETEQDSSSGEAKLVCPVTRKELGPAVKAVYLVPCGHAFSREAIEQMKGGETVCVQCNTTYEVRDIIPILPSTEADKTGVIQRMDTLRELGLTHALKKDKSLNGGKKRKAKDIEKGDNNGIAEAAKNNPTVTNNISIHKLTNSPAPRSGASTPKPESSSGIKNSATASLTARVLEEEEAKKRRRLLQDDQNENIRSLYNNSGKESKDGHKQRNADFMTRGFSIPAGAKHR